jgi:hypothetical protein
MQILINTDHHIEGHEALAEWAKAEVTTALKRHSEHITRVEIHVSDDNGAKTGHKVTLKAGHKTSQKDGLKGDLGDKRCVMEARLEGRQPLAVTQHADNLHLAVTGAADKLSHLITSTLGRAARMAPVPEPQAEPEPVGPGETDAPG